MSQRIPQSKIILVDYFFRPGAGVWNLRNNNGRNIYLSDRLHFAQLFAWAERNGGWKVGVLANESWESICDEVVRCRDE